MFLGKPFPFTLSFDPSAFNQKMQSARTVPISVLGRYGMATFRPFWRRYTVLKSGTDKSSPARFNGLFISPVVCRNGSPNKAVNIRQVWIAASLNVARRPRFPLGSANQTVLGSNQICSEPRCLRAALAIGLEPMAPQWFDRRTNPSCDSSGVSVC